MKKVMKFPLTAAITLLLVLALAAPTVQAQTGGPERVPDDLDGRPAPEAQASADGLVQVIIGFKQRPGAAERALVRGKGGSVKRSFQIIPAIVARVPRSALDALRADSKVAYVEEDGFVHATEDFLDWGVDRIEGDLLP